MYMMKNKVEEREISSLSRPSDLPSAIRYESSTKEEEV
jgi:hypothetical protein